MEDKILSRFKEKPVTRTGRWAGWFGLSTILVPPVLGTYGAVIRPMIDKNPEEMLGAYIGFAIAIVVFSVSVFAFLLGVEAYKKGERSWFMWTGFVPAILIFAFWIVMIVGEILPTH